MLADLATRRRSRGDRLVDAGGRRARGWPLDLAARCGRVRHDDRVARRRERAIAELGCAEPAAAAAIRMPSAPGLERVRRLLRPLDDRQRRPGLPTDVRIGVARWATPWQSCCCAAPDLGRAYWGWTTQEWTEADRLRPGRLPGPCARAGRTMRCGPIWSAHAYLLGRVHRVPPPRQLQRLPWPGGFSDTTASTGPDRRLRAVLAGWGYRWAATMTNCCRWWPRRCSCSTAARTWRSCPPPLFDRIRDEQRLIGSRLNALHALQRAVADLGFCDPPTLRTGRHSMRASWRQHRPGSSGPTGGTPPRR